MLASGNSPTGITVTAKPTPASTNATMISAEPYDPSEHELPVSQPQARVHPVAAEPIHTKTRPTSSQPREPARAGPPARSTQPCTPPRSSPASPHAADASPAPRASLRGQQCATTSADSPTTGMSATRQPESSPWGRAGSPNARQPTRPRRTRPGHPQVLTRHLREGLGRHLHAIQGGIADRQRSSPYGLVP
jgi:hypothetical protein